MTKTEKLQAAFDEALVAPLEAELERRGRAATARECRKPFFGHVLAGPLGVDTLGNVWAGMEPSEREQFVQELRDWADHLQFAADMTRRVAEAIASDDPHLRILAALLDIEPPRPK